MPNEFNGIAEIFQDGELIHEIKSSCFIRDSHVAEKSNSSELLI